MYDVFHIPVLLNESVDLLINPGIKEKIIVDGTAGGGGYSEKICEKLKENFRLICLDKDINALDHCSEKLRLFKDNVTFINENFENILNILNKLEINTISGMVLDLGLSSYQLNYEDGFSYMRDSILDMRADKRTKLTGADVINGYPKEKLSDVFEKYGEIGNPERLAVKIINERYRKKINTTFDIVELVKSEYRISGKNLFDFLSKIFQAVRIEVNNELSGLGKVLHDSLNLLCRGGRIVVVSYHSLEDRIVKNFFRENSHKISISKYGWESPVTTGCLKILTKKPMCPGIEEIKFNSRARSAKLRAAEKI